MLPNIKLKKRSPYKYRKSIVTNEAIEKDSYKFVHLLGYTILIFMAIDYVSLLITPKFLNPNWELETIGKIIETVYVTLLGFMLVFFRPKQQSIKRWEFKILSFLSWLTLFLGILCFLFAPLLISDSLRINSTNQTKIKLQLETQKQQFQGFNLQLDNLSNQQLDNLWANIHQTTDSKANVSPAEQKQQVVSKIKQQQQANRKQLQQKLKTNQRSLFKMTIKWFVGAIVAGVSFVSIWKYTQWARAVWTTEQHKS